MSNRAIGGLILGAALGFATIAALNLFPRLGRRATPEEVSQAFFLDTYTHDFSSAWDRISSEDQAARSEQEYLASNPLPSELQATLLDQLAEWGEFETLAVASTDPARAVVSAHIRFPHRGQREVEELLAEAADPEVDRSALLQQLAKLKDGDQLQFLEGDVSFDLVSEGNRWRIAQHWGQSVTVHLYSAVGPDLPWDFYPVVDEILAIPGELASASYFARNNSEKAITAKAIHEVGPPDAATYFQTIQCFCFTEQTLEPGEERKMVLLFRIDFSAPRELTDLENLYTFYSLDSFPSES
ncbi:MAG: cytochrome c oxidase assembly protein [Anaerolineales bacterium]